MSSARAEQMDVIEQNPVGPSRFIVPVSKLQTIDGRTAWSEAGRDKPLPRKRLRAWIALVLLLATNLYAAPVAEVVATRACNVISARVDAIAGTAPVFLRSYDNERGAGAVVEPSQSTAAYSYDNALAVIAMLACDKRAEALRVGEALRLAAMTDTRLRNAYLAGVVGDKVIPNGWWDARENHWAQDAYQQGTASGVVGWTALAMLALFDTTHEARWRDAALRLAQWTIDHAADARGAGGFTGGIDGFDANPSKLTWKSTEQNIDLVALFTRLEHVPAAGDWKKYTAVARGFVDAQWDSASGHFLVGTLADGLTPNRDSSGLDVQLWAQLLPGAKTDWRRALIYVEREHGVNGGFDFNNDSDGLWLEGTAQAALVYRQVGRGADADKLLATISAQFSKGGFVYATREPRITTGLAVGSASSSADFYYFRRPHLGATAWAALAGLNRNPFAARDATGH
jgi:hypothetical protein